MDVRNKSLSVSVKVPVSGVDVNGLELSCLRIAREVFCVAVRRMQEEYHRRHRKQLERREWRKRWAATRLGELPVDVLKVRDKETGRSWQVANRVLGLSPRQRGTRWVQEWGVSLRVGGLSYRGAASAMRQVTGARYSRMWLWRQVQAKGAVRCRQEAQLETTVFEAKKRVSGTPPRHLYLESDEIHVKAQRSRCKTHRVKVGLSYTGRRRAPGKGARRYQLAGKRLHGGVDSYGAFGRSWYAQLERHHGVSRAEAVLYLSDGDPGLLGLQEEHFPQAIRQLDWAHVFRDLGGAAPDERRRRRWIGQLCCGDVRQARRDLQNHLRRGSGKREYLEKVLSALGRDGGDFYGWKRYRDRYDPYRRQRIPRATGGIEKNQEVTIGRAMKRRGMSWSANGANHLAKLIFAWQDKTAWDSLWVEPPPLT